jgi:hypothetical protein
MGAEDQSMTDFVVLTPSELILKGLFSSAFRIRVICEIRG